mmetsp:Transcript_116654/g.325069  ORF Transcript_116654/g.325069 Transcript_116654/m.325069 type:complete len:281 (+) Transcript_116654:206-1048(+)
MIAEGLAMVRSALQSQGPRAPSTSRAPAPPWCAGEGPPQATVPCLGIALDAVAPLSWRLHALRINHDASTVQLSLAPTAVVGATVWPDKSALTMFQVLLVAALVSGAIGPSHGAKAVHPARAPLARVGATVGKLVSASAVDLVVLELPLIDCTGARPVASITVFAAVQEFTNVLGTIRVRLNAPTSLLVGPPFTLEDASIRMHVSSMAMSLVVQPLPIVGVAASAHINPMAVRTAISKQAYVALTVMLPEDPLAVHQTTTPLACVAPTLYCHLWALLLTF